MTEHSSSGERTLAVGIDLGTTNSLLAYLDEAGRPRTISNSLGDLLTPSAVLVDQGELCVGRFAVEGGAMAPANFASHFKRDIGAEFAAESVAGLRIPPEVLSGFVLQRLKHDAAEKLGPVKHAVITVPAFFDETRRRATQEAGALAGLEVVDLLNEPTAAAVAYGYNLGFLDLERDNASQMMRFLVYDLGGGTFDVTVLELRGRHIRALATDGDVRLGGRDFDQRLLDHLADQAVKREGYDPRRDPIDLAHLREEAQTLKHALTERHRASVMLQCGRSRVRIEVSRAEFEELTRDLLERTETTCRQVLKEAKLNWSQIDRVLLVGGSSRLPMVSEMLQEVVGKAPDRTQSPDEVVAQGAALYCGLRMKVSKPRFHLTNVNSHAVGVLSRRARTGEEVNATLIPKNSPLPAEARKSFRTAEENQKSVLVTVVEGEGHTADTYNLMGKCVVRGLPTTMAKGTTIEVVFHLSQSGLLEVRAELPSIGCSATAMIERVRKRNLESLDAWRDRLIAASQAPVPPQAQPQPRTAPNGAAPQPKPQAPAQPQTKPQPQVAQPQTKPQGSPAGQPQSPAANRPQPAAAQAGAGQQPAGRQNPANPALPSLSGMMSLVDLKPQTYADPPLGQAAPQAAKPASQPAAQSAGQPVGQAGGSATRAEGPSSSTLFTQTALVPGQGQGALATPSSHVLLASTAAAHQASASATQLQAPPGYPPNLSDAQLHQRRIELQRWLGQQLLSFSPPTPLQATYQAARVAIENYQQCQGRVARLLEQRAQLPHAYFEQMYMPEAARLEQERQGCDAAMQQLGKHAHEGGHIPPALRPHMGELDYLRARLAGTPFA